MTMKTTTMGLALSLAAASVMTLTGCEEVLQVLHHQ